MDHFNDSSISELISLLESRDQLNLKQESTDQPNATTTPIKISGIHVILKRLENSDQFDYGRFQNINHSNVAKYYYAPKQEKDFLMIEYVDERDIITFIRKLSLVKHSTSPSIISSNHSTPMISSPNINQQKLPPNQTGLDVSALSLINRVKIMEQVANAMAYLHSQQIPHLDLKPTHILLNKRGIIKLSGYGLFRLDRVYSSTDKSLRFKSQEVLFKNQNLISLKSDVYSFGIIFWELLTGRLAYEANIEQLPDLLVAGHRPTIIPGEIPDILANIITHCWQQDIEKRPSFAEIQKKLEEIIQQSPFDQKKYYNQLIEIAGLSMDMSSIVEVIKNSNDYHSINSAVTNLVNLLAYPKSKLQFKLYENVCEELTHLDIIPRLIQFLYVSDQPHLQFNTACVLTNIISGVHSRVLVENGALPALAHSCKSPIKDVFVQSCWILGNIGEESCFYHEEMLKIGLLPLVVSQFQQIPTTDYASREVVVWLLSNMVSMLSDKSFPTLEQIEDAIPLLVQYIDYENHEIQLNVLKGIHRLTFGDKRKNARLYQLGFLPKVLQVLTYHQNEKLVLLALKILGNFSSDIDLYTMEIANNLDRSLYIKFLQHPDTDMRMEFGLLLSNFFAVPSIAQKLGQFILIPTLFDILLDKNESVKVKIEILYCIYNAVEMGLVDINQCIPILNQLSTNPELNIVCSKFATSNKK
ncbi:LIM-type zinc finger-containing protein [Tieghemostelium lacteum]|uniref:LIM-type zinc finger-containing protein n=1 Tax=Tieghemostelium lacteum TaxID=361077 RepID=A0A151ZBN0_TIELA|nr:LIM-type zinc finger-containing protein [Tieghemostelium lacteum]|eukprot:KYQ91357.1 LIM-type zinc finger-containing protein [Tieghemostelium lacteum]